MGSNGLKGAQRIVYDELRAMLHERSAPTIDALSERSNYHPVTVIRALLALEECGLVHITRARPGCRSRYELTQECKR